MMWVNEFVNEFDYIYGINLRTARVFLYNITY